MHQILGYCRVLDLASGFLVSKLWGKAPNLAYFSEAKHGEEECGDGPWDKGELKVLSVVVKACRHLIIIIIIIITALFCIAPLNCLSVSDLLC